MSITAIHIEQISKKYQIGVYRPDTLRDRLTGGVRRLVGRGKGAGQERDEFWALRDVCFSVKQGEVVALIGHNGAGKSTLLKILSRITKPTSGRVEIRGRVGSLLEVGTGFHPELTGRENIYFNGSILGMSRGDIDRKFDEIVQFAEIGQFLDTPVKRYSSGMYVRLAFAVAAHLEPDILLVDEVLAVGDAAFQRKCLGKIGEVSSGGRTVLFVSHNMAAVQALCSRGILFRHGQVALDGDAHSAVTAYLQLLEENAVCDVGGRTDRRGKGQVRLLGLEISGAQQQRTALTTGRPARFNFQVGPAKPGVTCTFTFYDQYGVPVTSFNSASRHPDDIATGGVIDQLTCEVEELLLVPGRYRMNSAVYWNDELQDHIEGVAFVDVYPGVLRGRPVESASGAGSVCMHHRWMTSGLPAGSTEDSGAGPLVAAHALRGTVHGS